MKAIQVRGRPSTYRVTRGLHGANPGGYLKQGFLEARGAWVGDLIDGHQKPIPGPRRRNSVNRDCGIVVDEDGPAYPCPRKITPAAPSKPALTPPSEAHRDTGAEVEPGPDVEGAPDRDRQEAHRACAPVQRHQRHEVRARRSGIRRCAGPRSDVDPHPREIRCRPERAGVVEVDDRPEVGASPQWRTPWGLHAWGDEDS